MPQRYPRFRAYTVPVIPSAAAAASIIHKGSAVFGEEGPGAEGAGVGHIHSGGIGGAEWVGYLQRSRRLGLDCVVVRSCAFPYNVRGIRPLCRSCGLTCGGLVGRALVVGGILADVVAAAEYDDGEQEGEGFLFHRRHLRL